MGRFDLGEFNPTVAELQVLADKYHGLEINGLDDDEGYKAVKDAAKVLQVNRTNIKKLGKKLRSEALIFQKEVIRVENEALNIIVPLENELIGKRFYIDEEKKRVERRKVLPERKSRMKEFCLEITDITLLALDDKEFEAFYNDSKAEYLAKKEKEIRDAENKLKREQDLEAARLGERERIEAARKAEDARDKQAAIAMAAKVNRDARYQEFLKENDYVADGSFYIGNADGTIRLYKLVDSITL